MGQFMPFRMVNLGDSVSWGQGLLEDQKHDVLVKDALSAAHPEGIALERLAHSGAIIGPGIGYSAGAGEVPVPCPTIIDQVGAVTSPNSVDLVLLNGGINDVGLVNILNPLMLVPPLATLVHRACYESMLALLRHASAVFAKPSAKILVTGYYPILSDQSDPLGISALLAAHALQAPTFIAQDLFHNAVIGRCEEFFACSTTALQDAVRDAGDVRIAFVSSGFTDANSMFAGPTSLLWGLGVGFSPQDSVAAQRQTSCDLTFNDLQTAEREVCYRASAGHPNPAGAKQFAVEILSALNL